MQQITLENLHRCRARNQRQRCERARQGSDDNKEQEEPSEETPQQENCDQEVTGRGCGRASLRARPRLGHYNIDCGQEQRIPGGYEDIQNPKPYDFITANMEEHYTGNQPTRKWPNQAALL